MAERLLEVRDLAAGYRGVPVVRDVDLHVDAGELVVLFGPNGAGKSTTLLAVSGLVAPLAGSIEVLGLPVETRHPERMARRGLAHVPEDRSLFSDLSVADNLRLGARGRRDLVAEAAELFPALGGLADRRAGLLSGGEQQMLAMARALLAEPRLLLIDEMSLGLAPLLVADLLPVLRRVADDRGVGVLLVEQHVELALGVADRGIVLSHGRVVATGAADDLLADQALVATAYLGELADEA